MADSPQVFIDPFGLCSERGFNYVKAGVGVVNVGRAFFKGALGGVELAVGVPGLAVSPAANVGAPLVFAGAVLVTSKGIADVTGAYFLARRGSRQLGEAPFECGSGSLRNLLGLLPFGAEIDDPGESVAGAIEKARQNSFFEKLGELFTLF